MAWGHNLVRKILLTLLLMLPWAVHCAEPDYLLVLTSQRNAETIAEAARVFYQNHPSAEHLRIVARSDLQIADMTLPERSELIEGSAAILGIGLYGASVEHLVPRVAERQGPQLFIQSDHSLVSLSRWQGKRLFNNSADVASLTVRQPSEEFFAGLESLLADYPGKSPWIVARGYWEAVGAENAASLFAWYFHSLGENLPVTKPVPSGRLSWVFGGASHVGLEHFEPKRPVVAVVDHAGGERTADARLLREFCATIERRGQLQCLGALAYWGEAGVEAVDSLQGIDLVAVVMLQDFVTGGAVGRQRVTERYRSLNVPVIKAIKQRDRSQAQRLLSADGLDSSKVYYQVAMPELQGVSQPLVIATAGEARLDPLTGVRIRGVVPEPSGMVSVAERIHRWRVLATKDNGAKRIAIVYYNHPPGRHNIGADNLDVPATLWRLLNDLREAGYDTGELPASQEALLDMMQARGVNLPRDAMALERMSSVVNNMDAQTYGLWFNTLPATVRGEMTHGPFGLLDAQVREALAAGETELARGLIEHADEEMHHLLEGLDHPGRSRALALMESLEGCYIEAVERAETISCMNQTPALVAAMQGTGIEGFAGWGEAPGEVMVHEDSFLLPGITFGNVFIGPQPPRGWEINEELLHANLAFPPPHQYLAFYHWLHSEFAADALIHLGRHSTYEFLPRRSVGIAADDYSRIIASDLPGIYPYIVDGVGEGIQAKRRGLAVMVDHLTPPLAATPLYDDLLQLRQMVESFEASHGSGDEVIADRLVVRIRDKIDALELKEELAEAMSAELAVMGIGYDDVDDDMLVHEVGHYLTDLQERFMPLGLHVFGQDWQDSAVDMMLQSMAGRQADQAVISESAARLRASPKAEIEGLLNALDGGFVAPGQGNDPVRSPESLPTGRNFYALDSSLIPSQVAWELGQELAKSARSNNRQSPDKSEAVILWASDVVRDEGVMIAFGLDMLGLEPIWNSRGIVRGLKQQSAEAGRIRRDVVFTTSGLFRDLYGQQMQLLDKAVLMALDASAGTIRRDYPALSLALSVAMAPLGKEAQYGQEPLVFNQIAAHWVAQARSMMQSGLTAEQAGTLASMRIFGDAPGTYGAGINRLAERSGAWEEREELAEVYVKRLGHAYGLRGFGAPAQAAFEQALVRVENTYFGRSSNLYGLIDNNDAFDYLGGLSLTVEALTGAAPENFVIDHADPSNVKTQPLGRALRQELRGRFLNPEWLKGQMVHGYAGARTMGSEFLEYLWGWQVTNPTLVGDWAWEEVKEVYIDDRYDLGLDAFLEDGHNAHVKSNMLAIMLVAAHKGFWNAEEVTVEQLAGSFATLVAHNGLPGSGHTDPANPMLSWLESYLEPDQWQNLMEQIQQARGEVFESPKDVLRIAEVTLQDTSETMQDSKVGELIENVQTAPADSTTQELFNKYPYWFVLLGLAVLLGFYSGLRQSSRASSA
ncbi:MAG: cobaltochelatase subunit CobN [Pseudomonadota bacterium]